MILGCKCDLVEQRQVSYLTVREFVDEVGLLAIYGDQSAKENYNVEYAFMSFAAQLLEMCTDLSDTQSVLHRTASS